MVADPHGAARASLPAQVLVMRHPQTTANIEARYSGRIDAKLSETGEAQRDQAIEGLLAWEPTHIITSPLSRCRGIAEPVGAELNVPVTVDERFIELNFGILDGLTFQDALDQGLSFPWGPTSVNWPIEGAEHLDDFVSRIDEGMDELRLSQGRTAVICHGGVARAIACSILHIPQPRMWHLMVRNVESMIFSVIDQEYYVEGMGLTPQDLLNRKVG